MVGIDEIFIVWIFEDRGLVRILGVDVFGGFLLIDEVSGFLVFAWNLYFFCEFWELVMVGVYEL